MKRKTLENQVLDAVAPGLYKKIVKDRINQQMKINWNISPDDEPIVRAIAKRAASKLGVNFLDIEMDLTVTHLNGTPLRLSELLEADKFNFAHDIFGIQNHINRNNGKIEGFFLPRFSQPKTRGK